MASQSSAVLTACIACSLLDDVSDFYLSNAGTLKLSVLMGCVQKHTNAAQSLCDIIRLSREQIISGQDEIPSSDALLKTIEA